MTMSPSIENGGQPVRSTARQPILAANEKVIGYELLFRSGVENYFKCSDPNDATRSVIDVSSLQGLDVLCDKLLAFINCTRDILLNGDITILPPDRVVVEILETVTPDALVVHACSRLKAAGYKIALDDFGVDDPREALAHLADFIKVDLKQTSMTEAAGIVKKYRGSGCQMLAEKVETREEFAAAKKAGFHFFQGYFFRKPEATKARSVSSSRAISLRVLEEISKPEMNLAKVEEAMKTHATLCFRLLRYLNSAAFAFGNEIHSLRHALMILGEDELRRWCRLAVMLELTQNRPSDLVLSALVRARFSELLGAKVQHGAADLFLLGLLSLMDSVLGIQMKQVVESLPLPQDLRSVLLEEEGHLAPIYKLVLAVEAGEWEKSAHLCKRLQLTESFVAESHWNAMGWAQSVVTATGAA
jgi:EAL and modified HD-GYP domain-containing signal transduction protein